MALIQCPECGNSVSDKAELCIHCGNPLKSPLEKLIPKCDQLWEAKQYDECRKVCGDILALNPNDYVIILRHDTCRRVVEDNVSIGLSSYLKAVDIFNHTQNIRKEDATRFANGIIALFSSVISTYNYLNNLKNQANQLQGAAINPLTPTFGPKGDMLFNSAAMAKNKYKQQKAEIEPYILSFSREMYNKFPKKLKEITEVGKEAYAYIEKNAYTMNPEMKELIKTNNPALAQQIKNENKATGGCYVATCVYESYDCPQVWVLRRYRDNKLAKSWYGRLFIHIYYAVSPTIVKLFGDTYWFKSMWKPHLDKMIEKLKMDGYDDTPYQDKRW